MDIIAKHKKTGNLYKVIDFPINATNINDGQLMVLYSGKRKNSDEMGIFVREYTDFFEKFEIVIDES